MKQIVLYVIAGLVACMPLTAADPAQTPAQTQPVVVERTLAIIKPDAVKANHIGDIIARYEKNGLQVAGLKMVLLTKERAADFYAVHKDRPFYNDLVTFMSSGPVVVIALEGPNAVAKNREIMGATDPSKAANGTLRKDFGTSMTNNAVHGSDSLENAQKEIDFFFKAKRVYNRN